MAKALVIVESPAK
ncbi:MAG: hypothetical protein GTN90_15075, partial [Xanthomonadales bacterium]|nr:hypothetical protein [Xanthomonadales bacterium]